MYPMRRYKPLINPVMANIIATASAVGNAEMDLSSFKFPVILVNFNAILEILIAM
jgi:hypothetical protein